MGLVLFAGRSEHHSGQQIRYPSRKALFALPAFTAHSRDFVVAGIALAHDPVSGQVDVLGTTLKK